MFTALFPRQNSMGHSLFFVFPHPTFQDNLQGRTPFLTHALFGISRYFQACLMSCVIAQDIRCLCIFFNSVHGCVGLCRTYFFNFRNIISVFCKVAKSTVLQCFLRFYFYQSKFFSTSGYGLTLRCSARDSPFLALSIKSRNCMKSGSF